MTHRAIHLLCMVVPGVFALPAYGVEVATDRAGFAEVDITPPVGIALGGRGCRAITSDAILDPLLAGVTVLTDARDNTLVLVSFDLVGLPRWLSDQIREDISRRLAVPLAQVLLNCSHTHSGPMMYRELMAGCGQADDDEKAYMLKVASKVVELAVTAAASRKPVRVTVHPSTCDVAINRRGKDAKGITRMTPNPDGPYDPSVWILRLADTDGRPRGVLFSYACHPVIVYGNPDGYTKISADYPGAARRGLRATLGADVHVQFIQGPGGNVRPRCLADIEKRRFRKSTPQDAESAGKELAVAVVAGLKSKGRKLSLKIAGHADQVFLKRGQPPERSFYENIAKTSKNYTAAAARYWLEKYDQGGPNVRGDNWPVGVVRLADDQWIVYLAGEPVTQWAQLARQWFADRPVAVFGYIPYASSYLPVDGILDDGGYEVTRSNLYRCATPAPFAPGLNQAVHRSVKRQIAYLETEDRAATEFEHRTKPATESPGIDGLVELATFDYKPIITRLPDGTLNAHFIRVTNGVYRATTRRSRDNGRTWSDEETLLGLPADGSAWRGSEALVDRHGEFHLFIINNAKTGKLPYRKRRLDIWHAKSTDGRTRWTTPKRIWKGYTGALNSVIQTKAGRILLPFSYLTQRTWRKRGEGLDAFTFRGQFDSTLVYSDDDGDTWHRSPSSLRVTTPDIVSAYGAVEPVILERNDGRVWMLIRTQLGRFYESFSDDGAVWSKPQPTRLISSDSPAGLVRMQDGRIVLLWNQSLRFPYAHGGRHVLHAAVSDDDGRTWRGYREVARDPLRDKPPPPSGDHGTAYPFPALANDGKVIFTTGQGAGRTVCMLLDPAWLLETRASEDFSNGLARWHVFGTKGAALEPHPDRSGHHVLGIRKTHADWPAAAVWNFPALRRGRLDLRLFIEPGASGAGIGLTDHFSVPFDDEAELHNLWNIDIHAAGSEAVDVDHNAITAAPGIWHTVSLAWDHDQRACTVSVDGRRKLKLPQPRNTPGACYLRLRSLAEEPEPAGFFIATVTVDGTPPGSRTERSSR